MRFAKALIAAVALATVVVAPPWLLVYFFKNPYPDEGVSLSAPLTDGAIIGLLAAVVWVLWAQLMVCIAVEALAALTDDRVQLRAPCTWAVQQQLARRLVSAIVVATVTTPVVLGGGMVLAAAPVAPHTFAAGTSESASTIRPSATDHPVATTTGRVERSTTATVTVMRLDSLWSIAERVLGGGDRWPEIAALNDGRVMNDGTRFLSADHIKPGWELRVPDAARGDRLVVVEPGDTLSSIALAELGDAAAYPWIFDASRTITQPGGRHLTDPDVIDVGWTVSIPRPAEALGVGGDHDVQQQPDPQPEEPGGATPHPTPSSAAPTPPPTPPPTPTPEEVSPTQPAETSPAATAAPSPRTPDTGPEADPAVDRNEQEGAPWMLVGLSGGGALLAGGLLLGLQTRRRAQSRARRPGRAIAVPDQSLAPVEKSIAASRAAAATVQHTDAALRRLAAWSADQRVPMPGLAAVELSDSWLVLHLSSPARLPIPWQDVVGDGLRWRAMADETQADPSMADRALEDRLVEVDAPYPLLAAVGSTDDGDLWLLNCEELADVRVTGDPARGRELVRHIVAELAMNPWSELARVECLGMGAELVDLNPDRVTYRPSAHLSEAGRLHLAQAVTTSGRATAAKGDPVTGRTGQLDDDVWPAHLLLIDGAELTVEDPAWQDTIEPLRDLLHAQTGRTGAAVLVVGGESAEDRMDSVQLRVEVDGRLTVAAVGLELMAVRLTLEEAQGCAAILAQSTDLDDVEMPVSPVASNDGWEAFADQAGALRTELTIPRETESTELSNRATSVMDGASDDYVKAAAVTRQDLEVLAPRVPVEVQGEIAASDPALDKDIADWFDPRCARPRLVLLGPVQATAYGKPLANRRAYYTELLAFLALRKRHGVTAAQLADAFDIEVRKARGYVNVLRDWLGDNPTTGQPYLPHAAKAAAAQVTGVSVYQVDDGVLVDAELFRRLRVRGQARGPEGIADLRRALLLVSGRPFDQLREAGWSWLFDGERVDQYATFAVADVALLLTAYFLGRGDVPAARAAAEIAVMAAPDEEASRLSLARVVEAEGHRGAAEQWVRVNVCDRSDDGGAPTELSARTLEIIHSRAWLTGDSATASGPV